MKTLVVFDSNFGNTKIIAEIIAQNMGKETKVLSVDNFDSNNLRDIDLIIAGSPIVGWRPSEKMGRFLDNLKKDSLKGIKAASFDTRINVFFHGDAAKKISRKLQGAGAIIITEPEIFFVKDKEGPLLDGETEKALKWAKKLGEMNK